MPGSCRPGATALSELGPLRDVTRTRSSNPRADDPRSSLSWSRALAPAADPAAESGKPMMVSYVDRLGRRYRRRARPLSPRSINMHIDLLAQILAVAVDHCHLEGNPAVGKRRRMKVAKPRPTARTDASRSAATRPTPACATRTCCRCCARS
jgi:hypothetical protein